MPSSRYRLEGTGHHWTIYDTWKGRAFFRGELDPCDAATTVAEMNERN